jgi:hypothetical protein
MSTWWICFFVGLQIGATLVNAGDAMIGEVVLDDLADDPEDVAMEDVELNGLEDSKDQDVHEDSEDDGCQESELMWSDMWQKWHNRKPCEADGPRFYTDHKDKVRARSCVCNWVGFQRFLKKDTHWSQCCECWYWYHNRCVDIEDPMEEDSDDEEDDKPDIEFTCKICME